MTIDLESDTRLSCWSRAGAFFLFLSFFLGLLAKIRGMFLFGQQSPYNRYMRLLPADTEAFREQQ